MAVIETEGLVKRYKQVTALKGVRLEVKRGQIYGNRDLGSEAYVTNDRNFSYPGYSEILCGYRCLEALEIRPILGSRNPFPFMELQDMRELTNFLNSVSRPTKLVLP